jgi:hypothetical protein
VLAARGEVHLAFCWSHVRRPFYELAQSGPAPIASEALTRIAALYRIETDIPADIAPTSAAPSANNAAVRWSKHSSLGCARSCR